MRPGQENSPVDSALGQRSSSGPPARLARRLPPALAIAGDSAKTSGTAGLGRRLARVHHRSPQVTFIDRLLLHYRVYRGYPLAPWPAFKNACRIVFR